MAWLPEGQTLDHSEISKNFLQLMNCRQGGFLTLLMPVL